MTRARTIAEFRNRLETHQDRTALTEAQLCVSFRDLLKAAEILGSSMEEKLPKAETAPVIITGGRYASQFIALSTCLLKGRPFLLMDPSWPEQYVDHILALTNSRLVIRCHPSAHASHDLSRLNELFSLQEISPREPKMPPIWRDFFEHGEVAYLASTSGSTGEPKIAVLSYGGLEPLWNAQSEAFGLTPSSKVLQCSAPGFDAVISEFLTSAVAGSTLHCPAQANSLFIGKLNQTIQEQGISHCTLTPTVARNLNAKSLEQLETLVLAGEKTSRDLAEKLSTQNVRVINAYGPCEATVCTHMNTSWTMGTYQQIGTPLPGFRHVIANGELVIQGPGVALGYLNENETFPPTREGGRRFATGDQVTEAEPHGALIFGGRADSDVKVRGQKVNLRAVEDVLQSLDSVDHAACVPIVPAQKHGVEGATSTTAIAVSGSATEEEIRNAIKSRHPQSHWPQRIAIVEQLPLLPSGKLDAKTLTQVLTREVASQEEAGSTPLVLNRIKQPWKSATGQFPESLDEDFFDAGGDSLSAVMLVNEVAESDCFEELLERFLTNPTPRELLTSQVSPQSVQPNSQIHFQEATSGHSYEVTRLKLKNPISFRENQSAIAITGASGRVGVHVISQLLNEDGTGGCNLVCLGRWQPDKKERFLKKLESLVQDPEKLSSLNFVTCDLSIEGELRQALTNLQELYDIHTVLHLAAHVNHVYSLRALQTTNVKSTQELLKWLAEKSPNTRVVHAGSLSSARVSATHNRNGYDISKGQAEQAVARAFLAGYKAVNIRLPLVYSRSDCRDQLEKDHFLARLKTCIELGHAPESEKKIPALNAKDVAKAFAHFATMPATSWPNTADINLISSDAPTWNELLDAASQKNARAIQRCQYPEWRAHVLSHTEQKVQLAPFLSLYGDGKPFERDLFPKVDDIGSPFAIPRSAGQSPGEGRATRKQEILEVLLSACRKQDQKKEYIA